MGKFARLFHSAGERLDVLCRATILELTERSPKTHVYNIHFYGPILLWLLILTRLNRKSLEIAVFVNFQVSFLSRFLFLTNVKIG